MKKGKEFWVAREKTGWTAILEDQHEPEFLKKRKGILKQESKKKVIEELCSKAFGDVTGIVLEPGDKAKCTLTGIITKGR